MNKWYLIALCSTTLAVGCQSGNKEEPKPPPVQKLEIKIEPIKIDMNIKLKDETEKPEDNQEIKKNK